MSNQRSISLFFHNKKVAAFFPNGCLGPDYPLAEAERHAPWRWRWVVMLRLEDHSAQLDLLVAPALSEELLGPALARGHDPPDFDGEALTFSVLSLFSS